MGPDVAPPTGKGVPLDAPAGAVTAQLERILASRGFVNSERHSRFLRFTTEEALQGRGSRLKEYLLAVEVFNRKDSFDARSDAIVRVEASRIRAKLREYYDTDGREDPILIEYPRGSYAPVFQRRTASAAEGCSPPRIARLRDALGWKPTVLAAALLVAGIASYAAWTHPWSPPKSTLRFSSIAVLPFVSLGEERELGFFADDLTDELRNQLAKVDGLRVVSRTSSFQFKGKVEDIRKIGAQLNVEAVLEGGIRLAGDRLLVTAELADAGDGFALGSVTREFKFTATDNPPLGGRVACEIMEGLEIKRPAGQ